MSKLIHYIADCLDCEARYHARKNNHKVIYEKSYGGFYTNQNLSNKKEQ